MNFLQRNFSYHNMELSQLVARAVTTPARRERRNSNCGPSVPVTLEEDFPSLAQDFSSLLASFLTRQSSPPSSGSPSDAIRVWTHYDVLDNI